MMFATLSSRAVGTSFEGDTNRARDLRVGTFYLLDFGNGKLDI